MLSTLTDTSGAPLFTSIWDRYPPRIDKSQWPACVIMIPEGENTREAMRGKIDTFGCQLLIFYALPSVGWPSEPAGANNNIYLAPASEPQVLFDALIDQLINGLMANQSFTQNVPGGNRSTIQLGQKITARVPKAQMLEQSVGLTLVVEFAVQEWIVGV